MTSSTRQRDAASICCCFARNLAYYNATRKMLTLDREGFWLTVAGNFVDVCALEWSKLFGNRNGRCHWQKVLIHPELFEQDFLSNLQLDKEKWDGLWQSIKDYRDHFVAHVEDQETTPVPHMRTKRPRGPRLAAMNDFIPAVLVEKTFVLRNVLRPGDCEILKLLNVTGLTDPMQQTIHANTQLGHA